MATRAKSLRARRILVTGVVAAIVLGAVAVPLALLSRVGNGQRPAGPKIVAPPAETDGLLVVTFARVEGARTYFEGAFSYLQVETSKGRLVTERVFRPWDPPGDPALSLALPAGRYLLISFDRGCSGACPNLNSFVSGRCSGQFDVHLDLQVSATVRLSDPACSMRFENEPPGRSIDPIPDVAEIVCGGEEGTQVLTPQVRPQPDGVHLHEERPEGGLVFYERRPDGLAFSNGPGDGPNPVYPLPPGETRLMCLGGGRDPGDPSNFVSLTVVDDQGLWVSPTLQCPLDDSASMGIVEYAVPPEGEAGDPVELVRKYLQGIRNGDVVERAGYPDAAKPAVRVVRDGRVIVQVVLVENPYIPDPQGKWVFDSPGGYSFCRSEVEGFVDTPLG